MQPRVSRTRRAAIGRRRRTSSSEAAPHFGRFSWWLAALVAAIVIGPLDAHPLLANEAAGESESSVYFDIPAQPLTTALEAFSAASGYQVLMSSHGTPIRRSEAVQGIFPPKAVLEILIAGAGLIVRFTGEKAVVLLPDARVPSTRGAARPPPGAEDGYDAALQDAVLGALCRSAVTRPGSYRAALDLWVAASGQIDRAELLSSTGNRDRDSSIVAALRTASLASPPHLLARRVTVLLTIRNSAVDDCAAAGRAPASFKRTTSR